MCIYTCPVTFYPFLPLTNRREWEAMAGIITSQNTHRPPSSAPATQDYRYTVHKQVDRSCVPHCRFGDRIRGKKESSRGNEIKEGKEGQKQSTTQQAQVHPRVQITTVLIGHTWHLCLYDPDNVCWTWKDCRKSKVMPPQSFFSDTTEMWHLRLPCNHITKRFNNLILFAQLDPIIIQTRMGFLYCYGILYTRGMNLHKYQLFCSLQFYNRFITESVTPRQADKHTHCTDWINPHLRAVGCWEKARLWSTDHLGLNVKGFPDFKSCLRENLRVKINTGK